MPMYCLPISSNTHIFPHKPLHNKSIWEWCSIQIISFYVVCLSVCLFCRQSVCVRVSAFSSSHLLLCRSLSSRNHGNEINMQIPEQGCAMGDANCVSACRITHPHTQMHTQTYAHARTNVCACTYVSTPTCSPDPHFSAYYTTTRLK